MNALTDIPYRRLLSPPTLLIGDDERRLAGLSDAVTRACGRVAGMVGPEEGMAAVAMQAPGAGVVLDVRADHGARLDALLARIERLAADAARAAAIVIVPVDLIDIVGGRALSHGVTLLVDPDAADLDGAIAELLAPPPPWVAEDNEASSRRLAQLSEEVGRIARALAELAADAAPRVAVPSAAHAEDGPLLHALIRLRRLRGQHFNAALFADPAWDILLDLAVARIEGRLVAVSSLCIAASVPATTALRWITQMTEHALLVRKPDPTDGRRVFIALSDTAAAGMDAYLAAARKVVTAAG